MGAVCIKDVGSLHRGPEANGALSTHPEQSAYPILCLIKRRVVDIFIKARVTRVFWRSKPKSEMISRLCSKGHSFHFQQKRGATYRRSPFVTAAVTKKKSLHLPNNQSAGATAVRSCQYRSLCRCSLVDLNSLIVGTMSRRCTSIF